MRRCVRSMAIESTNASIFARVGRMRMSSTRGESTPRAGS
jgi:hypothetical protein